MKDLIKSEEFKFKIITLDNGKFRYLLNDTIVKESKVVFSYVILYYDTVLDKVRCWQIGKSLKSGNKELNYLKKYACGKKYKNWLLLKIT